MNNKAKFLSILIILAIALPFLVMWYVEYKGRSESLFTTILVKKKKMAARNAVVISKSKRTSSPLSRLYFISFFFWAKSSIYVCDTPGWLVSLMK